MSRAKSSGNVGPIIFADETARGQLLDAEIVITFRKNARTTGETWWRESRLGPKEGDVSVTEIEVVDPRSPHTLVEYQPMSGFSSVSEWQMAIKDLNGSIPEEGRLYRVEMR